MAVGKKKRQERIDSRTVQEESCEHPHHCNSNNNHSYPPQSFQSTTATTLLPCCCGPAAAPTLDPGAGMLLFCFRHD